MSLKTEEKRFANISMIIGIIGIQLLTYATYTNTYTDTNQLRIAITTS